MADYGCHIPLGYVSGTSSSMVTGLCGNRRRSRASWPRCALTRRTTCREATCRRRRRWRERMRMRARRRAMPQRRRARPAAPLRLARRRGPERGTVAISFADVTGTEWPSMRPSPARQQAWENPGSSRHLSTLVRATTARLGAKAAVIHLPAMALAFLRARIAGSCTGAAQLCREWPAA